MLRNRSFWLIKKKKRYVSWCPSVLIPSATLVCWSYMGRGIIYSNGKPLWLVGLGVGQDHHEVFQRLPHSLSTGHPMRNLFPVAGAEWGAGLAASWLPGSAGTWGPRSHLRVCALPMGTRTPHQSCQLESVGVQRLTIWPPSFGSSHHLRASYKWGAWHW